MIDVAIIGAGAAGIAAARRLASRGRSVLLIEALERIGGRARTVTAGGLALDLGCGWLHSAERNPMVAVADALGIAVDRTPSAWRDQYRDLGFPAADRQNAAAAFAAFDERLRAAPPASDRAGDAIAADDRWRPWLEALSGYINGAELDALSVADYLAYDDAASDTNWRVPAGYGTLIARAGSGLDTALSTPIATIDDGGRHVVLDGPRGRIEARAAIVAVPTSILADGPLRLPRAADDHRHAATTLPLGLADKLFFSLADPDALPPEGHLIGNPHDACTGSYYLRPLGLPVIECFYGGPGARALEQAGPAGMEAFARAELAGLLGTDVAAGLSVLAASAWGREPTIRGSYSHALPGHADARAVLARPIGERLVLAGEACSPADFSTAHGAWASGLAAADHVAQALAA